LKKHIAKIGDRASKVTRGKAVTGCGLEQYGFANSDGSEGL
jgi:hypothetical protein